MFSLKYVKALIFLSFCHIKLYDTICGFGHPGDDSEEQEVESESLAEVMEIKNKLEEQDAK